MGRLTRWLAVAATILCTLPLSGCNLPPFWVMITDFDSMEVLGIRLWKQDSVSGDYEERIEISFSEPVTTPRGEMMLYTMSVDGVPGKEILTNIERDPDDSGRVTMRIYSVRLPELGDYWLSSYNDYGDSAFSEEPVCL
jgi:hypothetical protein